MSDLQSRGSQVPLGHELERMPAPAPSPLRPPRSRASFRSPQRLQWKGDALHLDGKGRAVVRIVPDYDYPGIWRIELPDGWLTDMVNRTRVKDAALGIACDVLSQREAA
jgi:hypothetical protein